MYTQLECVYNFIRCENGKIESCNSDSNGKLCDKDDPR